VGGSKWEDSQQDNVPSFFKTLGGRFKRIRKRPKGKPEPSVYAFRKACLGELEKLAEQGLVDVFYGDESRVGSEGYVPYGWQFPGEEVCILSERGYKVNIFGLISRGNKCHWATSGQNIDGLFVVGQLERLSFEIAKETFVVLDNARVHGSKTFRERLPFWQERGLFVFLLPTYSPHLNIAETLWRKLKCEWLVPEDYLEKDRLLYAVNRCMANVGKELTINFSPFNEN